MISWDDYLKWFTEQYEALKMKLLEDGSIECNGGPILEPKSRRYPTSAPFGLDWAVIFSDGKYFRVKESFNRTGRPNPGLGVREHFSFHYGDAHPTLDEAGYPSTREPDTPPADLRIDVDWTLDPHIHLGTPEHITQDRVKGYTIKDADLVQFLIAVIHHRKDGKPLHQLLKIEVSRQDNNRE